MTQDITPFNPNQEFLIYQSDDGTVQLQVKYENETVWMTQAQLCDLFEKSKGTISEHISNIFEEGELIENSVVRNFRTTASDGKNYDVKYYNLDVIISVGYRVKSLRGTQFRIWATQKLNEYIKKGFVMDDARLADPTKNDYFEELLSRIRAIRANERYFYQKVTDIFATSIDYKRDDKDAKEMKQEFFASVQNKFHFAIHHHTAPEIIYERADASKKNMGLSCFKGEFPTLDEAKVGKNYLEASELKQLELLVDQYLSFAELQAMNRKEMKMIDWIKKLHDFLNLNDKDILKDAGHISRSMADKKVEQEYKTYMKNNYLSDFDNFVIGITEKAKKKQRKTK